MTTTSTEVEPSLEEQRAAIEAELKAFNAEKNDIDRARFRCGSSGDEEPERQKRLLQLAYLIHHATLHLDQVKRRIKRQDAETQAIMNAASAEAEAKWRTSLPEGERAIFERLTALERQVAGIVALLNEMGYRGRVR